MRTPRFAITLVLVAACGGHKARNDGKGTEGMGSGSADGGVNIGASVLEMHGSPTRVGAYIAPMLTHAAAATMHVDTTFQPTYTGNVYAQALFVDGMGARDLV